MRLRTAGLAAFHVLGSVLNKVRARIKNSSAPSSKFMLTDTGAPFSRKSTNCITSSWRMVVNDGDTFGSTSRIKR